MSASEWFYRRGSETIGPVSSRELKSLADRGVIGPLDLVQPRGATKWKPAASVKKLFSTAPVIELVPLTPPPRSSPDAPTPIPVTCGSPLKPAFSRHEALSDAHVVPDPELCVQCGTCTFNCPMGIDVRAYAWRGLSVHDSHCLTCAQCVDRCPRGVLRFEPLPIFGGG